MKKLKKVPEQPNFILCDLAIQSKFAQMCRDFQKASETDNTTHQDWLIIDNETGKIITKDHT